uniref:Solute carrier family 25 member 40 n=1 Tax=Strix occidentalis caurina TaxID=311401 RepID=A0A8D0KQ83_STROC
MLRLLNKRFKSLKDVHILTCGSDIQKLLLSKNNFTILTIFLYTILLGKCFVYSYDLMDHMCVCENGNSKDAFVKIIQIEVIKSLWSRPPPTLIMALPTTVIYFTCYDQLSEALKSRLGKDDEHIPVPADSLSRCKFWFTYCSEPLELIRTSMQYHKLSYKQLYTSITSKVATDGWLSLWRGWSSTVPRDVFLSNSREQNSMHWYNYERFKKMCTEIAASGSIAAVITLPFDVVKTYRQTELWDSETLKSKLDCTSTWAVMRKTVAKNSITGLFAGVIPQLFKVAPACAIMISACEHGKVFLFSFK